MADAVRDYVLRCILDDQATDALQGILDLGKQIAGQVITMQVDSSEVDTLGDAAESTIGMVDQLTESTEAAGEAADNSTGFFSSFADGLSSLGDTADSVADKISGVVDSISVGKIAAAGATVLGAERVFDTAYLEEAIKIKYKDAEQAGINAWLASAPPDVSYATRAGSLLSESFHEVGLKQAMAFTDVVEEYQDKYRSVLKTVEAPEDITDLMARYAQRIGNVAPSQAKEKQGEILGGMQGGRILTAIGLNAPDEAAQMAAENELRQKGALIGLDEKHQRSAIALQAVQDALAKKNLEVGDTSDFTSHKVAVMYEELATLTKLIEDSILPYLMTFVQYLTDLAVAITSVPGLAQFLGMITVIVGVTAALGPLLGILGGILGPLAGMANVMAAVNAAVIGGIPLFDALAGALIGFVGWPLLIAAALIGLGIALEQVEQKTHFFSKAWAEFSGSELGGDIIKTVQSLAGVLATFAVGFGGELFHGMIDSGKIFIEVLDAVFKSADGLYKFFKSGSADKFIINMSAGLDTFMTNLETPLKNLDPIGKFIELIYYLISKMVEVVTGFVSWVRGIWDDILTGIRGLPELIGKFFSDNIERLGNFLSSVMTHLTDPSQWKWETNAEKAAREKAEQDAIKAGAAAAGQTSPTSGPTGITTNGLPPQAYSEGMPLIPNQLYKMPDGSLWIQNPSDGQLIRYTGAGASASSPSPSALAGYGGIVAPAPTTEEGKKTLQVDIKKDTGGSLATKVPTATPDEQKSSNPWYNAGMVVAGLLTGGLIGGSSTPDSGEDIYGSSGGFGSFSEGGLGGGMATGGEFKTKGWAFGHPDEPVIQAEIAHSSRLQELLQGMISSPNAGQAANLGGIHVTVTVPITGSTEPINEDSIVQKIKDVVNQNFSTFEMQRLIEDTVQRSQRHNNA